MAVVIDSGPVSATQRRQDVPAHRWRELVAARRDFCAVHLSHDCRELLHFVEDAAEMLTPLGYTDVPDFIRRGLELDPAMVTWAVEGLKQLKPHEPIPFHSAITLGKRGRPTKAEQENKKGSPSTFIHRRDAAYLLARLDRDHPDVAVRVRNGELKAKTAAREVGIVKTKTPLEQLQHWWRKASPDERLEFLRSCRV